MEIHDFCIALVCQVVNLLNQKDTFLSGYFIHQDFFFQEIDCISMYICILTLQYKITYNVIENFIYIALL